MKKTTSKQVKKRRIRRGVMMAACALCLVIGFGGKAYAEEGDWYGSIWLNYNGSITATRGTSTTSGAPDPYLNYASVVIYGEDGKSQGTTYTTGAGSTTASLKGSKLKKAVTYHAAVYTNGAFLEDFSEQLIYTVTR